MNTAKELIRMYRRLDQSGESALLATLATIVEVQGSHYSRVGTRMLITKSSETAGAVSLGCLRADVIERAHTVMRNGESNLVTFDTTTENDLLLGSGMGCGGKVSILLEPAKSKNVRQYIGLLERCEKTRSCSAVATVYGTEGDCGLSVGDRFFYDDDMTVTGEQISHNIKSLINADMASVFSSAISINKTYSLPNGRAHLFIDYLRPPVSIMLFGGGDDVMPVCGFAGALGWQVTVIDPRSELLTHERFPQASYLIPAHPTDPKCFESIGRHDGAVVMTHNFFRDLELLRHLLNSKLRYIGLLGATKRVGTLLAELGADITNENLNKLYAPVGLDIGAETPEEIALAIVAEIQTVLCSRTGQSLREKRANNSVRPVTLSMRTLSNEGAQ